MTSGHSHFSTIICNCLVRYKKENNWSDIYQGIIVGRRSPLLWERPPSVGGASLPRTNYGGRAMNSATTNRHRRCGMKDQTAAIILS